MKMLHISGRSAALLAAVMLTWAASPLAGRTYGQAEKPEPPKRPMTLDDLWKIKRLGQPSLSPNGQWVAVEVTSYCMEDNESTSDIWLISTDGEPPRQLTAHAAKDSGPRWSPDGKHIAFVSNRDGDGPQVYLISPEGGEARKLTRMPMAPSGLKWAADSKTLYCIGWTWPDATDDDAHRRKEKEKKERKVQAAIIDDAQFRYWDRWLTDGKRPMVFAIDLDAGRHRNLLAGTQLNLPIQEPSADDYDVSPDGRELCIVADSTGKVGLDFNNDLFLLPLEKPGVAINLTKDNEGHDMQPAFSPDGQSIAFIRQTTKFFYADRMRLMVHERKTGKNREISGKFDRSCSNPQWGPDSERICFQAEDKGYVRLYAISKNGDELTPITRGYTDRSFELSSDGKQLIFLRSSFDMPATLHVLAAGNEAPRKIESFNDAITSRWELGEVKEIYFKGADDREVQMWVVYPPGFDAKQKWPLLQIIHGGPHNGITTDFSFRWNLQLFAARGYIVACVNFHGSSGFGQEFTDSITGDLGRKPSIDILKATDYLEAQPYIDKNRTTAAGASYGGYLIAWLNGHTDRFKAMICHAGVYNWHSMMASDIVRTRERSLGTKPWGGDLSKIDQQTPQRFAANFKTPTLVMHGEKDYRVPVTQGFEFYNTLKQKEVPTRLVYFPDENHWILKPQNSRLWHDEFFAWLEKYVGRGPSQ
jgi:dipeptidyl aminopeptidase/acylaminoacyl peptidase